MSEPLVSVENLQKYFYDQTSITDRLLGAEPVAIKAVDGVSFDIHSGETLGLVGESGCGKSTTGETILRLQEPTGGRVVFDDTPIFELDDAALREFRQNAQIVFQDPFSSLDPRMTVGQTVRQPLDIHSVGTPDERRQRAEDLLERVGLSADQFDRYPSEFSGGQRQRVGIARALALNPDFLVLDEPTSALDVSVQAQILNLLSELQEEFELTYLLISHDLSVIRHICDRVAVMYLGELVEIGPAADVFTEPRHPYTKALLESVPRASSTEQDRDVTVISGDVPSPRSPPSGCRFRTRCPAVIQPPGLSIEQSLYREIMSVRERIERRELDLAEIRDRIDPDDHDDPTTALIERLFDRLFDTPLPPEERTHIQEAFEHLVADQWADAATLLADRYESVCETVPPALSDQSHPVACHLHEQPAHVQESATQWRHDQ